MYSFPKTTLLASSSSQYLTFPDDDVESVAMSGYSDYIMSASSSIADIVNNASSVAASAAGQVAYQVLIICGCASFCSFSPVYVYHTQCMSNSLPLFHLK